MTLRSFLFVPADSERKYQKASGTAADALIVDLEDSVAKENRPKGREMCREYLQAHRGDRGRQQLYVRINPLETDDALPDLAAIMAGAPDGIVQPKTYSADCTIRLDNYLTALEAREGLEIGSTKILVVATETARSLFTMESFVGASKRIYGLTWGAEDLSAALFASTNRAPSGAYEDVYRLARTLCLASCRAGGFEPVDVVYPNFRDLAGMEAEAVQARKTGFTGKIAIHPDQVEVINRAFTPGEEEVAYARRVVKAFEDAGMAGTVGLDGKMLDMPHLKQARYVLSVAERFAARA